MLENNVRIEKHIIREKKNKKYKMKNLIVHTFGNNAVEEQHMHA